MLLSQKKTLLEKIKQSMLELLLTTRTLRFKGESGAWEELELGEVITLEYGASLPETQRIMGEYPIIGSNGIIGYHKNFLVKSPAIIVGRKGSAGRISYSDKNCYPIDTTYFVKLKHKCNSRFVYFLLLTLKLEKRAQFTGVPGLNRNDVCDLKIPLPPLPTQQKIAHLLSTLDRLIELTHQEQQLLARITRALRDQLIYKEN
ncbi:restriction endonuclease subunit S [Helicobacter bizzozeronii]|uniref:restriction endonuclease subunit S n=1 Tax=Helicobacter bizzozeronii TaxID=56877 RepID=UPI000CEEA0E6|nr:restriction endonuclease subunit S [Helicobacter bizzozeronii]